MVQYRVIKNVYFCLQDRHKETKKMKISISHFQYIPYYEKDNEFGEVKSNNKGLKLVFIQQDKGS
jgi:hypothetical protein